MRTKPGLVELGAGIALCAASAGNGESWLIGLYLACGLMVIASLPILCLNYCCLSAKFRATFLNCVVLPYSTFLIVLQRVLMLPLAEHLKVSGASAEGKNE